tara:strand:- start:236 stop:400 length:165 start_codon:yes stop_codon:yes gene_type:complete
LPIIFQILYLTEELSWEDKMRLNIENNNAFVKMVKMAFFFAGIKILLPGCIGRR